MLKILLNIFIIFGFSFIIWSMIGLIKFILEKIIKKEKFVPKKFFINKDQIAVLMPAHNEELVIEEAICALKKIISPSHIYIANDGSTDNTSQIVLKQKCNIYDIMPNRGKAAALALTLDYFNLYNRYKYVLLVDADTRLRADYLKNALPLFNEPKIAAVAGFARSEWKDNIFIAYRSRVWFLIQIFLRFGMTWKFTNVNMIVPGFASIYRTQALKQIEINKKDITIEDFNMTFELHRKKLGKIAHYPNVTGFTQDPDNFKTYSKQIKRWNLGFWQTVKQNGFWPSFFWLNLLFYLAEIFLNGIILFILPLIILLAIITFILNSFGNNEAGAFIPLAQTIFYWLIILFFIDYLWSLITALFQNKPQILFYGPGMLFFRLIDAYYLFTTFLSAPKIKSEGKWASPIRWAQTKKAAEMVATS